MPRWVPPKTIQKRVLVNDDPQRHGDVVSDVLMPVRFELLPGSPAFHHAVEIGVIGDVFIWNAYTRSGYRAEWRGTATHRFEIHFVETGECRSTTRFQDVGARAGQAYLLHDAYGHRYRAEPGTRHVCISVPLARYARLVTGPVAQPSRLLSHLVPVLDAAHPAARVLRSIANILHADGENDNPLAALPLSAAILKEALLQTLAAAWPQADGRAPHRVAPRYLRRATEWIASHVREKITLEDIAAAAGTSSRTLQVLFREQIGTSPMRYLMQLRLQHAHEDLIDPANEQTISEIARTWGFRHMGDFERYYKTLYGRTPCESRRQARFQRDGE